ncbi:MAG: hypothetical protein RMK84_19670 [Oscillochloridaceae bacterium]|nr:hypothetical protein [Chloroflexaceae bacterium]MDW8392342.1 hypothetical protein [Oscillochloridaceae bacterium]
MDEGRFAIPTRIYLTAAQRAKLLRLLEHADRDLDELLSELVVAYLETQAEPPTPPPEPSGTLDAALRQRKAELRRLRPKLNDPHNPPPAWLRQMAAELEQEIARLERERARRAPPGHEEYGKNTP